MLNSVNQWLSAMKRCASAWSTGPRYASVKWTAPTESTIASAIANTVGTMYFRMITLLIPTSKCHFLVIRGTKKLS